MFLFVFTTELMKFSMSSFCPLASCKETDWNVTGSRIDLMSASGRLVTHMRKFGSCESTRFSKSVKTSKRGDDSADVFGHSSKASITR